MTGEFRMPSLGAGMSAGTVLEWHVGPGDRVGRGDVVGVVDTEKGAIDVEIWEDGEVVEVLAPPGTEVPVGEPLLRLRPADGEEGQGALAGEEVAAEEESRADAGAAPVENGELEAEPAATGDAVASRPEAPDRRDRGRVRASPAARRRARELSVELAHVKGSGPGGAVTLPDVEAAAEMFEPPEAAGPSEGRDTTSEAPRRRRVTPVARQAAEALGLDPEGIPGTGPGGAVTRSDVERAAAARGASEDGRTGAGDREPPEAAPPRDDDRKAGMRRAVAAAMAWSKREIPHYYLATTVSLEAGLRWLAEANRDRSPAKRLLPVALHLKALAGALTEYPELNGLWEDGQFHPGDDVHVGLAISLRGGGLVAPAIHRVPERSLDELTAAVRDVVLRARTGKLRGTEVSDPTVTLTSLGERGVETVFGVIHPPQVAILGVGTVVERPWAQEGMVGAHRVTNITLSADHRVSDGHRGGLFLEAVNRRLQNPEGL